jgi:hypothetical protein
MEFCSVVLGKLHLCNLQSDILTFKGGGSLVEVD